MLLRLLSRPSTATRSSIGVPIPPAAATGRRRAGQLLGNFGRFGLRLGRLVGAGGQQRRAAAGTGERSHASGVQAS